MAHEIDFTTQAQGSAMFAYEPAWHGFGTVVGDAQTSADALRIAGLDWDVLLTNLAADFGEQAEVQRYRAITTHRATYRADTGATLGAVGLRYQPLQNREAFAWMDEVIGGDKPLAIWHTCGSLREGRKVWMLAKMPGNVEVTDRDVLEKYVLITNSHDGTGAVRLFPTSVRVVCANTLRLAIGMADAAKGSDGLPLGLKLFHTVGGLRRRVERARECLGVISDCHEGFGKMARMMMGKSVSTQQVSDYFTSLVDNRSERGRGKVVTQLWDRFALPTNEGGHGANVWTAYNAASEWADHELRVNGRGDVRAERKFQSVLFGTAHSFKERAWANAIELAV
jgi:phage/plasmid-like protein (TIGR03299 family)